MIFFWVCLTLLVLLGVVFLLLPLWRFRNHQGIVLPVMLAVCFPFVAFGLYWHWGNYEAVSVNYLLQSNSASSSKELIAHLEKALQKQPENYRAWYLLGESWMATREFSLAADAFSKASEITDGSPKAMSQYAQALFLANKRQITPKIEGLVDRVILMSPNDRTALGLKGIADFEAKRYNDAVNIWRKLLKLTHSTEARKMIESGIKKAKQLESFSGDS